MVAEKCYYFWWYTWPFIISATELPTDYSPAVGEGNVWQQTNQIKTQFINLCEGY